MPSFFERGRGHSVLSTGKGTGLARIGFAIGGNLSFPWAFCRAADRLGSMSPPLGAHMSIAGGYYRAVELAKASGCDCVQLFTKNNNQWRAKEITAEEANRFRASLEELGIAHPIAHSSYLINLASPDEALREKSIESMIVELRRAEQLGIPWVVVHPGSHTTASEAEGLANVARSVDQ